MNEIEKMYENVGELIEGQGWVCKNPDHCTYQNLSIVPENCSGCEYFERERVYPLFTVKKQIELIKWLAERPLTLLIGQYKGKYYFGNSYFNSKADSFENALVMRINDLWQNLTEEEKQQVKEILNG